MTLTPAGRAEILRAAQRDEFFKEQLSNNASELLHLIGGVRLWLRYKDLVQMTIRIFYDILMTALNLQTLGEEFTGMVQVNRTATALPKKYVSP
ncbi:hypothetical protein RUM43_005254 [Polyplax serrata]|uniref:Pex N-terminal domain-containing protein n=1 Tax=Polyplax serrata TaxID=468196 RepID=A0AAN8NQU7_POLSC